MAVKTMAMGGGDGKFNDGWHELAIATAEYGTYKSPNGEKKYLDLTFEGYPENMNLRVYEVTNKQTGEEFKVANLFRYANAGILGVLKDPTGTKPVIQYDDEPSGLICKKINALFYKEQKSGNEYMRIFDTIAPVEQEGEHLSWNGDQVAKLKMSAEKNLERMTANTVVNTTSQSTDGDSSGIPF